MKITWRPDYSIFSIGHSQQFIDGYAGEVREFCDAIPDKRPANPIMTEMLNPMCLIETIAAKPDGATEL